MQWTCFKSGLCSLIPTMRPLLKGLIRRLAKLSSLSFQDCGPVPECGDPSYATSRLSGRLLSILRSQAASQLPAQSKSFTLFVLAANLGGAESQP
jgi:hypothetical protein